jgi:hypothetical protein
MRYEHELRLHEERSKWRLFSVFPGLRAGRRFQVLLVGDKFVVGKARGARPGRVQELAREALRKSGSSLT